jgi:hypothetical protein
MIEDRHPVYPSMQYLMSRHAREQMEHRHGFGWTLLSKPEQRIAESADVDILQSRFTAKSGKMFLLRAVVDVQRRSPSIGGHDESQIRS